MLAWSRRVSVAGLCCLREKRLEKGLWAQRLSLIGTALVEYHTRYLVTPSKGDRESSLQVKRPANSIPVSR